MRRYAVVMGGAFLFGGLLGFVPGVVRNGLYLGVFRVNPAHNLLHVASGAIFLVATAIGARAARSWFRAFGLVYAAMAVWGLQVGDGIICGVISNNRYDAWGHAGLAAAMLFAGFGLGRSPPGSAQVAVPSRSGVTRRAGGPDV